MIKQYFIKKGKNTPNASIGQNISKKLYALKREIKCFEKLD